MTILDAVTDAGVIRDDAQVYDLRARKVWTGGGDDTLMIPGVRITVTAVDA